MKYRLAMIGVLLVLLQIFISCYGNRQPYSTSNQAIPPSPEIHPTTTPTLPEIRLVELMDLWRTGDESANIWKEARVRLSAKVEIKEGELVTVVPLDVEIAPINVSVASSKRSANPCDEELPDVWEIELEAIAQAPFLEAKPLAERREETPFEVCLIYPHVPFARQLKSAALSNSSLPREIPRATLTAAIDLTNDLQPEVLVFRYCCNNRDKPVDSNCDYICGGSYIRKNDLWHLLEELKPC